MPASPLPCLLTAVLLIAPFVALFRGRRQFLWALSICGAIVGLILLANFVPGWWLMVKARNNPQAQFELARWTENHSERINALIIWPFEPDVLGGYARLESAANLNYPPAIYAVGWRLKYGTHVPMPAGWTGPGGNCFPQPERGQAMIDRALSLGYMPPVPEEQWWAWYRNVGGHWE